MISKNILSTSSNSFEIGLSNPIELTNEDGILAVTNNNFLSRVKAAEAIESDDLVTFGAASKAVDIIVFYFSILGNNLSAVSGLLNVDGYRVVPFNCSIIDIFFALDKRGKVGDNVLDIYRASTSLSARGQTEYELSFSSLYTIAGDRPTIAGNNTLDSQSAIHYSKNPGVVSLYAGDIIRLDSITFTQASSNAILQIYCKKV